MKPLKIIQVASGDLWGGAEAQVNTLCKYLSREPNVIVEVVLLNHGELESRLKMNGISVHVLDETSMSSVEIFLRLRQLFRKLKPDVIHTHRQKENILASFANLMSVRAICVRTQHGATEFEYSWAQWKNKLQIELDRFCGKYLQHKVIAVSDELKHKLSAKFSNEHLVVVENGVDLELLADIKPDAPFRLNEPDYYHVGIVGRLVPVKRIDLFLDMAKILLDSDKLDKPIRVHVIGDGPLRSSLERQQSALDLNQLVRFHGHTNNSAQYIKSLDVLVMCSDHEGLPMTLLEAIALGTPIVSHNAGALSERLSRSEDGVLSEHHEPESYATTVMSVLLNTQPIKSLSENISAEKNADTALALYQRLAQA